MNGSFVKLGDDFFVDVSKVSHVVNNGEIVNNKETCRIFFDGEFDNGLFVDAKFADVTDIIGAKSEYLLERKKCG